MTLLIADDLGITDVYDFKLFEIEDNNMRPIMDGELVLQLVKKFFKKKSLLFRKYLFLPNQFDTEEQVNNVRRLKLITYQHFYEIQ